MFLRRLSAVAVSLLVSLAVVGQPASPAAASTWDTTAEETLVTLLNVERTSRGLSALRVTVDLLDVGRRHSARMSSTGTLYHNPNLATEVTGWLSLAENVGYGSTAEGLHKALMNSSGHRANILGSKFTQIGVGAIRDGSGRLWITQVFRQPDATKANAPSPASDVLTPAALTAEAGAGLLVGERSSTNGVNLRRVGDTSLGSPVSLGGSIRGVPDIVAGANARLDVLARGTDDRVWMRTRTDGTSGFSTWYTIGGATNAAPAAATWGSGRLDVFVRGTDGAVWQRALTTKGWSRWHKLGGRLAAGTGPAVASSGPGRLTVLVHGTDRQLWKREYGPGGWSSWQAMGGTLVGDPAAASPSSGRVVLTVRGSDGAAYARVVDNGRAGGWHKLGGKLAGSPGAAAVSGSGRTDVMVLGTDGKGYRGNLTSGWSGWQKVG